MISNHVEKLDQSEVLNDPIAKKISWAPVQNDDTKNRMLRLDTSPDKIRITVTPHTILSTIMFSLTGLLSSLTGIFFLLIDDGYLIWIITAICFGVILIIIGLSLLRRKGLLTLDKANARYYAGRPANNCRNDASTSGWLSEIYAIQLLGDKRTSYNNDDDVYYDYPRYEMNIILKNGDRINVMVNGDRYKLEDHAVTIGKFLSVPIWKGKTFYPYILNKR